MWRVIFCITCLKFYRVGTGSSQVPRVVDELPLNSRSDSESSSLSDEEPTDLRQLMSELGADNNGSSDFDNDDLDESLNGEYVGY